MADKVLVNTITIGTDVHHAGDTIHDAAVQAKIAAQGGVLIDTTAVPEIVAVAATALAERLAGRTKQSEAIMLAGAAAVAGGAGGSGTVLGSTSAGQGASEIGINDAGNYLAATTVEAALQELASGGASVAAAGIQKRTVTITQAADLAGLGAGVKTLDKNIGAALPANARIVSATAEAVTDFDDATHGTYTAVVGTSAGGNQIGTSLNVAAGQSGFPKAFTAGAQGYSMAPQGSAQLSVRLTSSVDLNTATAGALTVCVFFIVLA